MAVHSAKDMTSTDAEGLAVARFSRERILATLCAARRAWHRGCAIGTASARRRAQLLALEPGLTIEPLRGNVDTRLRKRGERGLDAIVLAAAGLDRLGLAAESGPSVRSGGARSRGRAGSRRAPGASGWRKSSSPPSDDPETRRRVTAERACVARIGGGLPRPRRRASRRRVADRADRRRGRILDRA